jgi:outer membrane lipase/esterase
MMSGKFADSGSRRGFSRGRKRKTVHRRVNTVHLRLEPLEPRYLLSGFGEPAAGEVPEATDNHYLAHDEASMSHNMVTDDTGAGVDTGGGGGRPLVVTEINGQPYEPDMPRLLASEATLTVNPDGSFVYDPTTSPTLGAIPPGAPAETDSFTYTVAAGFSDIIVFGDSLSDVGNLYDMTGGAIPPPPYWQGHFTNGPVWVEHLASRLSLQSTLDNNYAVGGACTGQGNSNEAVVGMDLPGLQDEIAQFTDNLSGGPADAEALYVVWAGPNDFFASPADIPAAITQAVGNIVTAVGTLRVAGAEHILVPNIVDLGITPFGISSGMASDLTQLSAGFNFALYSTLDALGLDVIEFDVFSVLNDMVNDPGAFGFSNVTDACFDGSSVCANPDEYLFWDSVHPAAKGHELFAGMMFEQLITNEPLVHSDTATVKISVSDATTPVAIMDENLYVGGTNAADTIVISSNRSGKVRVRVNGDPLGTYDLDDGARVIVFGHEGNDWIDASRLNRSAILYGGEGCDCLVGGRGSDILYGGAGSDFLYGNAGADTLFGGDGNDFLFGGQGDDILFGNAGNDWIFGQLGDDRLDGGDGYDCLFGGWGTDVLKDGEWSFG